jgi:hypothetical protein
MPSDRTTPPTDALRNVVFRMIREWLDRGEVKAVGSVASADGFVPVTAPDRLTVSLDNLNAVARAAGFSDGLVQAFEEVELGPESDPPGLY